MSITKRKQKGSSLVIVLMAFSVLTILGVSVLSLTASAFKSRIVESAERRHQYFAESGIDIAYGIIGEIVDQGIKVGNQSAEAFIKKLQDDNVLENQKEIVKNGGTSNYINQDGTVNEAYIKQMENQSFQDGYKKSIIDYINGKWYENGKYSIPITNGNYGSDDIAKDLNVTINAKQEDITFKEIQYKGTTSSALTLNLVSDFEDGSMIKTISVNYSILLPNYKDIYYVETNKFKLPINPVWNKAFCIDGNLEVTSNFEVNGDVYVKGNDGETSGINITGNGTNTTFNGNISSFGGVQVSNKNNSVKVNGNVYTGNMVVNNEADVENLAAKGATLTIDGAVYTNNDLAVNGQKSIVNIIKGFYGINDVNKAEGVAENQKPKVSSCLLVNSDDLGNGTSIAIGSEAILMGTAYIKQTNPSYQTGESVAIKGNYRAYTNPLNSDMAKYETDQNGNIKYEYTTDADGNQILKKDANGNPIPIVRENGCYAEDNVIFEYIDPLQLVTKFNNGNDLSWQDKSNYFNIYAQEYRSNSGLNLGNGITLPYKITHIGSIVANNSTIAGNYINDDDKVVKDKQEKYALKIYAMDDASSDDTNSTPIDLEDAFAKNELKRRIFLVDSWGRIDKSISQVDFTSTKFSANRLATTSTGDIIYLNNNNAQDCIIVGKNASIDKEKIKEERNINLDNAREINLQNGSGRGIILTRGNVYLAGEVDFKGTIISTGNMQTLDSAKKTLNYNSNYVERLIAYNYDSYFEGVFIRNSTVNSQNIEIESNVNKNDNNAGTDVLRDKLIIMQKWKIIK